MISKTLAVKDAEKAKAILLGLQLILNIKGNLR
jgi:hypothetical protein